LTALAALLLSACGIRFDYNEDPCAENGVTYTDEEATNIAVSYLLTLNPKAADIPADDTKGWTVSYDNLEDFYGRNPDCCFVERPADKGGYVVAITYFRLHAQRPKADADAVVQEDAKVGKIVRVDSCGNAYKI
jgi:hypothetical protein